MGMKKLHFYQHHVWLILGGHLARSHSHSGVDDNNNPLFAWIVDSIVSDTRALDIESKS